MSAPATCTLSDVLYGPTGAAEGGGLVRCRVVSSTPPVVAGSGHATGTPVVTYTASDGTWSLTLPQGLSVWIEIPAAGVDHTFTVPSTSTATLADVSLVEVVR